MATKVFCDVCEEGHQALATWQIFARQKEGNTVSTFRRTDACADHVGLATARMTQHPLVVSQVHFHEIIVSPIKHEVMPSGLPEGRNKGGK